MDPQSMPAETASFRSYLFEYKNRVILIATGIIAIIIFLIFKYYYPFSNYIYDDSFVYLDGAIDNLEINTYPIGYSKFLRLFSVFSSSNLVLVGFQYALFVFSILYFMESIMYFYNIGKVTFILCLTITLINPLPIHLANMISSDSIFLSLSIIWLTLIIWALNSPTPKIIVALALVSFLAFIVRYNALYYPLFTAVILLLANLKLKYKAWSLFVTLLPVFYFIVSTSRQYQKTMGIWQFSPFSGWQIANNAMYALRYVEKSERKQVPDQFKELHNRIVNYFDTIDYTKHPYESLKASTHYMWTPNSPLVQYQRKFFSKDSMSSSFKKWATMGPLYKKFGIHIIRTYPLQFIQHFIFPNAMRFYSPPVEYLEVYNNNRLNVPKQATVFFKYNRKNIYTRTLSHHITELNYYPYLCAIANLSFLFLALYYFISNIWKHNLKCNNIFILFTLLWAINALFTIIASPAALRFQSFAVFITIIANIIYTEIIIKALQHPTLTLQNNKISSLDYKTSVAPKI